MRWRSIAAWSCASLAFLTYPIAKGWELALGLPQDDIALSVVVIIGVGAMCGVGALIASRTANALGWLLIAIPATTGISLMAGVLSDGIAAGAIEMSDAAWAWVAWSDRWLFLLSLALLVAVFYLFPTGAIASARWRWPWRIYLTAVAVIAVGFMVSPTPIDTMAEDLPNPMGLRALAGIIAPTLAAASGIVVLSAFVSFASLASRYRAADPEARQQLRWLFAVGAAAAGSLVFFLTTGIVWGDVEEGPVAVLAELMLVVLAAIVVIGIPVATGVAIFRYHLYDLNVVVRKTLVVASLAAFISLVYVAIVVGVGAIAGSSGGEALPVIATAAVALLFQPARARAHRFANRMVYGVRATPYEVISGFTSRMSSTVSTDDVLPEMAAAAGRGVGATAAVVTVHLPSGRDSEERWTSDDEMPGAEETTFPVTYRGEEIGSLTVGKPANEPLTRAEHDLLADLASHAGLALHNVRLTEELQIRLRELDVQAAALRVSRERLVTARDAQRRGLQRDLHEGPERQLVAIGHSLAEAERADPDRATTLLDDALTTANQILEGLRDLARGIFPPLLADQGIVAALEAHVRKLGANARIVTNGVERLRFDADVEACVYFCCLQTIQNVIRHAGNAACAVTLATDDGAVLVTIADEGQGFDTAARPAGMGLAIVRDRVDALEGSLDVTSAPGAGTTIRIRVPATALEGAGTR
ncbi:MAG: ATP-binding protein [Actinomycetota bacterium]